MTLGLLLALVGPACASNHYAGIDLRPGRAQADIQHLARTARGGSKQAQFDLARRFETGAGVPQDVDQARRLYAAAAADSGGPLYIYVPKAGKAPARVQRFDQPVVPGLPEARARLAALDREQRRDALVTDEPSD